MVSGPAHTNHTCDALMPLACIARITFDISKTSMFQRQCSITSAFANNRFSYKSTFQRMHYRASRASEAICTSPPQIQRRLLKQSECTKSPIAHPQRSKTILSKPSASSHFPPSTSPHLTKAEPLGPTPQYLPGTYLPIVAEACKSAAKDQMDCRLTG